MPPEHFGDSATKEKKSKGGLIAIIIVFVLIGALVAVIAFDIGGIREDHIMRYLRGAPLIGSLFPVAEEEEEDPLLVMSDEELRLEIHNLRQQVQSLESQRTERDQRIATLNTRVAHLSLFENRWNEYRHASALFTQMLAHNDPLNFTEFFEQIVNYDLVPQDILADAYAQAAAINIFDEELRSLVSTYNNMEEKRAAEDLEQLMIKDTALAVRLTRAMGAARRGAIFEAMEATVSTTFAILLSTAPPTFAPLVPPPYLPEIREPIITPPPTPIPVDEIEEEESEEETENEI
jgi:hypothetical protein